MYSSVKQLHIEIEQRIQQITSNRHRSIAPQFYDMVLNTTAISYIHSILSNKTNYKREGLDESSKRLDDLRTLKRKTGFKPVIVESNNNSKYVYIPADCLQVINSNSKVKYDKFDIEQYGLMQVNLYSSILDFSKLNFENVNNCNKLVLKIGNTTYDITDLLQFIQYDEDKGDTFEFINLLVDRLRFNNYNAYLNKFDNKVYNQGIYILFDDTLTSVSLNAYDNTSKSIDLGIIVKNNIHVIDIINPIENTTIRQNDLIPTELISDTFNNYYLNKNRHLNPITEVVNDRLNVYTDKTFIIDSVDISYIKKPILFNSELNQMSDMTITPEFLDDVVSNILLILKDDSFQYVKQNIQN